MTVLVLLLVAAGVWGVFGRIEVNLVVDGIVVRPGERNTIVSAVSGTVTDVLVKPGDVVAAQAPIATVEPAGLDMRVRIARTAEDLLADLVARSSGAAGDSLRVALAQVQAERVELTAVQVAGRTVVSPHAGQITAAYVAPGDTIDAGATIADVRTDAEGDITTVAVLAPEQASMVQPGALARVFIEPARSGGPVLLGEVATVAETGSLPPWFPAPPPGADQRHDNAGGHFVTFSLTGAGDHSRVEDLQSCRLEIVRRISPLEMLTPTRGG